MTHTDSKQNNSPEPELATSSVSTNAPETIPKEQYLHVLADLQNLRRQSAIELERRGVLAQGELLSALLPLIDFWHQGLSHVPDKNQAWFKGLEQVEIQLHQQLADFGVKPVANIGDKFDPSRHEALDTGEDLSGDNLVIATVAQQGYSLRDQLIYPARVTVISATDAT